MPDKVRLQTKTRQGIAAVRHCIGFHKARLGDIPMLDANADLVSEQSARFGTAQPMSGGSGTHWPQQPDGVFAVLATIGAELIRDRFLVFLAGFAITFTNGFQIFTPGIFYHITVSFSVTCNMAQRYFLEYFSVTFNVAQFGVDDKLVFGFQYAILKKWFI